MKIVITIPARRNFRDSLSVIKKHVTQQATRQIRKRVRAAIDEAANNPGLGQVEESLVSFGKGHRRVIQDYFKIVYYVKADTLYVTDIFDTRQDPRKLNC